VSVAAFTGPQEGMTEVQRATLRKLLPAVPVSLLLVGGCIGADDWAAQVAWELGIDTECYPSDIPAKRIIRAGHKVVHPAAPPLDRNKVMVDRADFLIATPTGPAVRRSGTWSTIRYAHRQRKHVVLALVDGTVAICNHFNWKEDQ
jgi:hypothetical protein